MGNAPKPFDRGDPNRVWPELTEAHADEIGKRLRARFGALGGVINIGDWSDSRAIERLRDNPFEALKADRSLEALFIHIEEERAARERAGPQPTAPKATAAEPVRSVPTPQPDRSLSDMWLDAMEEAGLDATSDDENDDYRALVIRDRAGAVKWFEAALAEHDEAHPDRAAARRLFYPARLKKFAGRSRRTQAGASGAQGEMGDAVARFGRCPLAGREISAAACRDQGTVNTARRLA